MCKKVLCKRKIIGYVTLGLLAYSVLSVDAEASDLMEEMRAEAVRQAREASETARRNLQESRRIAQQIPGAMHAPNRGETLVPLELYAAGRHIPQNFFTSGARPQPIPQPAPVVPQPLHSHISAIGRVLAGDYSGTGTHWGNGIVATAHHVISSVLPENFPATNDQFVFIPLRPSDIKWAFSPVSARDGRAQLYNARGVVVFNYCLRNYNGSRSINFDVQSRDIALILLDRAEAQHLPVMPVIDQATDFGNCCVMAGYGNSRDQNLGDERHYSAVRLFFEEPKEEVDVLHLDGIPVTHGDNENWQRLQRLLDMDLAPNYALHEGTRPGDSGGPVIAETADGRIVQIGINSVGSHENGEMYSGAASLIGGQHYDWHFSLTIAEMWRIAKLRQGVPADN